MLILRSQSLCGVLLFIHIVRSIFVIVQGPPRRKALAGLTSYKLLTGSWLSINSKINLVVAVIRRRRLISKINTYLPVGLHALVVRPVCFRIIHNHLILHICARARHARPLPRLDAHSSILQRPLDVVIGFSYSDSKVDFRVD